MYAILLDRVDPTAYHALGFEGRHLKPGAEVSLEVFWPDGEPRDRVLLEHAGVDKFTADGRRAWGSNRGESLYILWRYCASEGAWFEVARSKGQCWEWAVDLRPIAVRLLKEIQGPSMDVLPSLNLVAQRIAGFLDQELRNLDSETQGRVLSVIHHQLASRFCSGPRSLSA